MVSTESATSRKTARRDTAVAPTTDGPAALGQRGGVPGASQASPSPGSSLPSNPIAISRRTTVTKPLSNPRSWPSPRVPVNELTRIASWSASNSRLTSVSSDGGTQCNSRSYTLLSNPGGFRADRPCSCQPFTHLITTLVYTGSTHTDVARSRRTGPNLSVAARRTPPFPVVFTTPVTTPRPATPRTKHDPRPSDSSSQSRYRRRSDVRRAR